MSSSAAASVASAASTSNPLNKDELQSKLNSFDSQNDKAVVEMANVVDASGDVVDKVTKPPLVRGIRSFAAYIVKVESFAEKLQKELSEAKSKAVVDNDLLDLYADENKKLKKDVNDFATEMKCKLAEIDELQKAKDEAVSKVNGLVKQIADLNAQGIADSDEIKELKSKLKKSEDGNEELYSKLEESENDNEELKECEDIAEQSQSVAVDVQLQYEAKEKEIKRLASVIEYLKVDIKGKEDVIRLQSGNIARLQDALKQSQEALSDEKEALAAETVSMYAGMQLQEEVEKLKSESKADTHTVLHDKHKQLYASKVDQKEKLSTIVKPAFFNNLDDSLNKVIQYQITYTQAVDIAEMHGTEFHKGDSKETRKCRDKEHVLRFPRTAADFTEEQLASYTRVDLGNNPENKYYELTKIFTVLAQNCYCSENKCIGLFRGNISFTKPAFIYELLCVNHPRLVALANMSDLTELKKKVTKLVRTKIPDFDAFGVMPLKEKKKDAKASEKKKDASKTSKSKKAEDKKEKTKKKEKDGESSKEKKLLKRKNKDDEEQKSENPKKQKKDEAANNTVAARESSASSSSSTSVGVVSENNEKPEDDLFGESPIQEKPKNNAPASAPVVVAVVENEADTLM